VCLYVLLSGCFPFDGEGSELARQIVKGDFIFYPQLFDHISSGAKDVISGLLTVDADKRFGVEEVRTHPWIRGEASDKRIDKTIIVSIRRFNARRKFKRAIVAVMAGITLSRALKINSAKTPVSL
jgi:serine/threonine protein kinase